MALGTWMAAHPDLVLPTYIATWRLLDDQWLPPSKHRQRWSSDDIAHVPSGTQYAVELAATRAWHAAHPEVQYAIDVMDMHG